MINGDSLNVEKTLVAWKKYLEKLEQKPYSKLTTSEIDKIIEDPELKEQLAIIDRYIYATREEPKTTGAFNYLLTFARERFHKKIAQIKNG